MSKLFRWLEIAHMAGGEKNHFFLPKEEGELLTNVSSWKTVRQVVDGVRELFCLGELRSHNGKQLLSSH